MAKYLDKEGIKKLTALIKDKADSVYQPIGSYLTSLAAGQGISVSGNTISLKTKDLDVGTSNFTDGTELITSYASDEGFSKSGYTHPYKRPASAMWNYIKGKADSTYQAKGSYAAADHTHSIYYDTLTSRSARQVLAAPSNAAGAATFRALETNHMPDSLAKLTTFTVAKGSGKKWYRIAATSAHINLCSSMIKIHASASGLHTSCLLSASTAYNSHLTNTLQQFYCAHWSTPVVTAARLVYPSSHAIYNNKYMYLEIYAEASTNVDVLVNIYSYFNSGWNFSTVTGGSIPTDYTSKTISLVNGGSTYVAPQEPSSTTAVTIASMVPNKLYRYTGATTSINISAFADADPYSYKEYMLEFYTGANCVISVPSSVKWAFSTPKLRTNKWYQVSIVNNLGVWAEFG